MKAKKGKKKFTKKHLAAVVLAACILVAVIWLSNLFMGNTDNPVQWSRDIPRDSISSVELTFWNLEDYPNGLYVTMTDDMVDELFAIIKDFRRDDFVRGSIEKEELSVFIRCYNAEFLLDYKDGAAEMTFDDESGQVYGGGRDWKIVDEAFGEFVEKYKEIYFEQLGIVEETEK